MSDRIRFHPDQHHRRNLRLRGYDYAQSGAYYLTLCIRERECVLGEIMNGAVVLSEYGQIVQDECLSSEAIRPEIGLDTFVIMPNHLHGIVFIRRGWGQPSSPERAHSRAPLHGEGVQRQPRSLGAFIAGFKAVTTKRINQLRGRMGVPVWQRNFYERVIRNDAEINRIREYIRINPAAWNDDENHPLRQ